LTGSVHQLGHAKDAQAKQRARGRGHLSGYVVVDCEALL
jgi:hypothetical protein